MAGPAAIFAGISAGLQLYGAIQGNKAGKKAGKEAQAVAYANAIDILAFANANAESVMATAGINASATRAIGYANAAAIERAATRNIGMVTFGLKEDIRRHIIQEKMIGGEVQGRAAASGWVSDRAGGTPRIMIEATYEQGAKSRDFLKKRGALTILTMGAQAQDDAHLQRLTADVTGDALLANAGVQSELLRLEGAMRSAAERRAGDLAKKTGSSAGFQSFLTGITGAASIGANYWIANS